MLRSPAEGQEITSRKKVGYLLPFLFTRTHQWSPFQNEVRPYTAHYASAAQKYNGHSPHFFTGFEQAGDTYMTSTVPDHACPRLT